MGEILFNILGPVALIVALGFVVGRTLDVEPSTPSKLSYWVFGPAFVFDALYRADLAANVVVRVVIAAAGGLIVSGLVGWAWSRFTGGTRQENAAVLTTSMYGNVGNYGLAVVVFTFGPESLPLAALLMVVINITGLLVGVASATGVDHSLGRAARTAFLAPMFVAVIPAVLLNIGGTELPPVLDRPVALVAQAMIPLMLVTLGMQLAGMGIPRLDASAGKALTAKLLIQPAVAAWLVWLLRLDDVAAGAVVIQAAMPPAVFSALIALEHDLIPDRVTTIVLGGTLISAVTVPLAVLYVT
ncbi:MAG: AEC family transporter [Acidimicrobiia bacterium]|nr:AEC family transporter [Acidimicrobiia bacterium]